MASRAYRRIVITPATLVTDALPSRIAGHYDLFHAFGFFSFSRYITTYLHFSLYILALTMIVSASKLMYYITSSMPLLLI